MSIIIYNTLSREKEIFMPLKPDMVSIYVCGPTVYDSIHVGNARSAVVFDMVRRFFEYQGFTVNYVSNFTDIDDRIINRGFMEEISALEVADRYVLEILDEFSKLGIKKFTHNPRVTEEMPEIIEIIELLIGKDYAYEVEGHVYFETHKKTDYGKLSGQKLENLQVGARVSLGEKKKNPTDFVLWKPNKKGEPFWDAPWGKGRPGWHIECSAMVKKYLGDKIDIHGGGDDLIFPHHENEIAQSEAVLGKNFVGYWMHNGMLNINDEKMSKSLKNFFFLSDITKEFPYDVIRYFFLSVHYRSQMDFSDALLEASKQGLRRLKNALEIVRVNKDTENNLLDKEAVIDESVKSFKKAFLAYMKDDFNTAGALGCMHDCASYIYLQPNIGKQLAGFLYETLYEMMDVLGIFDAQEAILTAEMAETIEALLLEREDARKNKAYDRSDEIRTKLLELGVEIKDTREGTRWEYHG